MSRFTLLGSALLVATAMGACSTPESATSLDPSGPPKVRQVLMTETLIDSTGASRSVPQSIAFGDHPDIQRITPGDDHVVTGAALGNSNHVRVVVGRLLVGNYLEQISCRDGSYQSVPLGTTPDDIARCAVADDQLADLCTGEHAVCLDASGAPIGVEDEVPTGGDGAADDTQFIAGIAHINCHNDDTDMDIDVPLDLANTFWQPAGNQQVPAAGEFNSVGPAIILATVQGFPSNSSCGIDLANSIVDKDSHPVCAPPNGGFVDGEIDQSVDCPGGETGGDTTLINWGTEPVRVPLHSTFPDDGATGVALTASGSADARIVVKYNTDISMADVAGFTLLEGANPRTITVQPDPNDAKQIFVIVPGGYVAATTYTLTIGAGSAYDGYNIPMPASAERTITFTSAS
jgi:hypothetical protein